MAVTQSEYDRGFNDGLSFVISCLRRAAAMVETPTYADFERKNVGGNGGDAARVYRGVAKSGAPHFAAQLRSVATEIEAAIAATKAPPDHGSKT